MTYEQLWELHFQSEPFRVRTAVGEILAFLEGAFPYQSPEERWEFKLIFSELLLNAVVHGNASDGRKNVHVYIRINETIVSARIEDEGNGYDYKRVLDRARSVREDDWQNETGRGVRIALALTDDLRYTHKGKHVTFTKKVGKRCG
jgi:anti-sigma regulatory factor (Ser/Thr protein kinase)